ncbi:MAG TPA: winged helix-turn-helix domain-containing protein [Candidatus Thermoplasmatota archaeon]|nr:winged helix-turn-helix domain-containing protein [Candidatus Thermoplasmatota archaeon]
MGGILQAGTTASTRFLCILLLATPHAGASGALSVGPATVALDNGHASGCVDPSGLCLASLEGEGGAMELDARQNVAYLGVAVDDGAAEDALGHPLLPDGLLALDGSDIYLEHDVFVLLIARVGSRGAPAPLDGFGLVLDDARYGVRYVGPSPQDPTGEPRPRALAWNFSDEGVGKRRLGPFHVQGNTSTDARAEDAATFPCVVLRDAACEEAQAARAAQLAALTPNARVGLAFHRVALAASRDALEGGALAAREGAAHALERPALPQPPSSPRSAAPSAPARVEAGPRADAPAAALSSPAPEPAGPSGVRALGAAPPLRPPGADALLAAAAFALALVTSALLYSRFHRDEALRHERRAQILSLLEREGPQSFPQLGRALGVDRTTVEYHARMLQRTGHLRLERAGKLVYALLPRQALDPRLVRAAPDAATALLRILRERGGELPRAALHEAAEAYPQRARNHAIARLARAGAIERVFVGNVETLRLTARASSPTG